MFRSAVNIRDGSLLAGSFNTLFDNDWARRRLAKPVLRDSQILHGFGRLMAVSSGAQ